MLHTLLPVSHVLFFLCYTSKDTGAVSCLRLLMYFVLRFVLHILEPKISFWKNMQRKAAWSASK